MVLLIMKGKSIRSHLSKLALLQFAPCKFDAYKFELLKLENIKFPIDKFELLI